MSVRRTLTRGLVSKVTPLFIELPLTECPQTPFGLQERYPDDLTAKVEFPSTLTCHFHRQWSGFSINEELSLLIPLRTILRQEYHLFELSQGPDSLEKYW